MHNLAKMQHTSVFLKPVRGSLVSFAQKTFLKLFLKKTVFLVLLFFLPNGNGFFSFSAEIRSGAANSTVSLMSLLKSTSNEKYLTKTTLYTDEK